MDPLSLTLAIFATVAALSAVFGVFVWARGPSQRKQVSKHPVGLRERFRVEMVAPDAARRVLWLRYRVTYTGNDDSDYGLTVTLSFDGNPPQTFTLPGGGFFSSFSSSGGEASHAITTELCGLRARPAGTPIVLEGVIEPSASVRDGGFVFVMARR